MKRILFAAVAALTVVAALVASASGQSAPTTIHLVDHTKGFAANDIAPAGIKKDKPSLGDTLYITGKLTGDQSGTDALTCQFIVPGKHGAELCNGVAHLSGGDIFFTGRLETNDKPAELAVTGGTGDYAEADGTIGTTDGKHNTTIITVSLTS
jgi:hypothetical protein